MKLLTQIQKIEDNFGLTGLLPMYKPPKNLILTYDRNKEKKVIIKAESENDINLAHVLNEGFGLSIRSEISKGAFWFGKIIHPSKEKRKNEWHRFSKFLSSQSERKIENRDKWYPSKHAGGEKTVRRRIKVEIDLSALKTVKTGLIENARILANDPNHKKWINQSRADARRNRNPEIATKRLEEKISWWGKFCSEKHQIYAIEFSLGKRKFIDKSFTSLKKRELQSIIKETRTKRIGRKTVRQKAILENTTNLYEKYQTQALLNIINAKKPAFNCLADVFKKSKVTNIEFSKVTNENDEIASRIKVVDAKTGKIMILRDIIPLEELNQIRVAFDVFHENRGANIAFKAQLEFFNRYNPSQSPLVCYLGLNPNELKNSKIELQWSDRKGYPSTGVSMTDTFAPDIVVRNSSGQIIAVIQLKGYSQTRTSLQPNSSVFQVLELKKYDKNPEIKTALVSVNQEGEFIKYEWLVLEKQKIIPPNGEMKDKIYELGQGYEKFPELDPLIPKNLRKRAFVEDIYDKIKANPLSFDISSEFNNLKKIILRSERNFYQFIGLEEENSITEEIVQNYLNTLQDKLQIVVNSVGKTDGINSSTKFRYYWAKEVVMDYYEKIKEHLEHSKAIDK